MAIPYVRFFFVFWLILRAIFVWFWNRVRTILCMTSSLIKINQKEEHKRTYHSSIRAPDPFFFDRNQYIQQHRENWKEKIISLRFRLWPFAGQSCCHDYIIICYMLGRILTCLPFCYIDMFSIIRTKMEMHRLFETISNNCWIKLSWYDQTCSTYISQITPKIKSATHHLSRDTHSN